MDSIFTKIINKEIPADIVYEDDDILAFKDINPQAPVHILIIPKKDLGASISDLSDYSILEKIGKVAKKIAEEQGIEKEGYRLVTNSGSNAGQEVPYLHFHLLGGRKMTWPPG